MKINLRLLALWASACFIDVSIFYIISLLTNYILLNFVFIEILKIYLFVAAITGIISFFWKGQTPGKYLLGIELKTIKGERPSFLRIIVRELFMKCGLGIFIPYLILFALGYTDFYFNLLFIFACISILTIVYWAITKSIWWNQFVKTNIVRKASNNNPTFKSYIFFVLSLVCSFFIIRAFNNYNHYSELKILGFNYPEKYIYPPNDKVKNYVKFLSQPHLSPKDYVFELFKQNNVVILCERFHPETTQWDLIYDIVSDKRFIESVGNIFTEYGNQDKQSVVNKFLTTNFLSDSMREKEAANLMHNLVSAHPVWYNSAFFYFINKLNVLNSNLSDSVKIHEYYTNLPSWDYIKSKKDYDSIANLNYDLVMATNVINRFRHITRFERRKKCLVITDYRHAFNNLKIIGSHDEASYIYRAFPNTTANILLNSVAMKYPIGMLWLPIDNGAWDKAFSQTGNKPIGFNFSESPFGKVEFETNQHLPLGRRDKYQYKDVFTGYIFNNPLEEFRVQDFYPYIMDNFENEYRRRYSIIFKDTSFLSNSINKIKCLGKKPLKEKFEIIFFQNCIELILFLILISLAFVISTYHTFVRTNNRRKI